jgi:hypothetical protein
LTLAFCYGLFYEKFDYRLRAIEAGLHKMGFPCCTAGAYWIEEIIAPAPGRLPLP